MRGFKGEYLGFTFNDIHSSALGIVRTANGMSSQDLSPNSKDITASIEGRKDVLYYGTTYSTKDIPISFAFERLTDAQIQKLKELRNDEQLHRLILDEEPYKYYMCKITGTSVLKHISFVDINNNKYYNGEGSFTFTCYFPYALSRFPYLEDYNYLNIPEWNEENEQNILTLEGYAKEKIVPKKTVFYEDNNNGSFNQLFEGIAEKLHTENIEVFENSRNIESTVKSFPATTMWPELPVNMEPILTKKFPSRRQYGLKTLTDDYLEYHLYNCGDESALFGIWLDIRNIDYPTLNLTGCFHIHIDVYKDDELVPLQLRINYFQNNRASKNDFIYIDFYKQVIQGYNLVNNQKIATNNLYNNYISNGDFFEFEADSEYKIKIYFIRMDTTNVSAYNYNLKTLNPEINLQYVFE